MPLDVIDDSHAPTTIEIKADRYEFQRSSPYFQPCVFASDAKVVAVEKGLLPFQKLVNIIGMLFRLSFQGGMIFDVVLSGFELGTDVKIVRYPDRYMDERGTVMWDRVMKLIGEQRRRLAA
jgi:hypothetical protein